MKNKLKEARLKANLTQEELAEKSNVNRTTIVQLEAGKDVNVTIKTMKNLAGALNTSVEEILG